MLRLNLVRPTAMLVITTYVAACGGGPAATPTIVAPTAVPASVTPGATQGATGPANLEAVDEVEAGKEFEVTWTGPNGQGDYVTIVKLGATQWTNEAYFNTSFGSPQKLLAPSVAGAYELWYVAGLDRTVLFRRAIQVTPFQGSLTAPDSVEANKEFEVAWTGPNGTGDYVTIVKLGATQWTNEAYFNTSFGSPQKLLAPIEAGAYELWYVIGSDRTIQVRRGITVTATSATVDAPREVARGAAFQVSWTGPNGPGDYVTVVPAGSPPNTYQSYFNTSAGSPGTLTAPTEPGNYEVWYVAAQGPMVLASVPIKVT